jgi:hypothetical protein
MGKTHNQIDHMLADRRRHSNVLDVGSFMAADCNTEHYLVVAKFSETLVRHRFDMEMFNLKQLKK